MATIPSIAMIPSGYKANKVYSVLPTDGSGDLDSARTTTARRINSDGLIEEVAIGVPRLDYTDGSCPSLLLEPASTNLITYSEDYSNAYWTKSGATVTSGFSAPSVDSPLGAFKLVEDTSNSTHYIATGNITVSLVDNFASVIVKPNGRDWVYLYDGWKGSGVYFNITTGVVGSASGAIIGSSIEALSDGYYRIGFGVNSSSTSFQFRVYLADSDGSFSYQGDGTSGVYIFASQLEQNSYASSYIKTLGTAISRTADSASKSGISSLINSSEGVFYAEISALNEDQPVKAISISNQSLSNRVLIVLTVGELRGQFVSGTDNISKTTSGVVIENFNKIACSYTSTTFKVFVNGLQIGNTSAISTALVGLTGLSFDRGDGGLKFVGKTKQLQVYKTALTDAQLTTLTTL